MKRTASSAPSRSGFTPRSPLQRTRRHFLVGGTGGQTALADLGLLVLRVFAGLALAFGHGIGKIPPSDGFVAATGALGFPLPLVFAWLAALAEFGGGLLLALGLLTRPAALLVAVTMGVAAFAQHAADPFAGKEKALLFLAIAVCFLLAGAGRYSVDALLRR